MERSRKTREAGPGVGERTGPAHPRRERGRVSSGGTDFAVAFGILAEAICRDVQAGLAGPEPQIAFGTVCERRDGEELPPLSARGECGGLDHASTAHASPAQNRAQSVTRAIHTREAREPVQ